MTKIITAHIPARTVKGQTKTFRYQARTDVFTQDDDGRWSLASGDCAGAKLLQDEVIDICRRATNWAEIKATHFVMDGFAS